VSAKKDGRIEGGATLLPSGRATRASESWGIWVVIGLSCPMIGRASKIF
jgi:hypothetical protein